MADVSGALRVATRAARVLTGALGVVVLMVAAYGLAGELNALRAAGLNRISIRDAAAFVGLLAGILSGGLLLGSAASRVRVHLPPPQPAAESRPVYGFTTILAIGIGSTLGSPLFLLIPVNVIQYEIVSILSLVLAAVLSIAMAKNNADSYGVLKRSGRAAVGGPAFVGVALGTRSARYFISRFSMAVANTALAAYCVIVFVVFVFGYLPGLLNTYGIAGPLTYYIVALIVILFAGWFVMNSIFERRYVRLIGRIQIVFTSLLVLIVVVQSYLLGSAGAWSFRSLWSIPPGSPLDWVGLTVVNTGYLYLLFFGFQEIQALDREAHDRSPIPVLSWIRRDYTADKSRYFGIAMVATVLIAAGINIFYALAVFAANPSAPGLTASQIPALYVARSVLGGPQEALMGLAFMLATFTTFVPAFLAATRHIRSLGEDGFLPRAVARGSWLLVLAAIAFLVAAGRDFLVNITDYMVLVSLGIIALAAVWLRRDRRASVERKDALAVGVGVSCLGAAAALYVVTPSVAVFGSLSIVIAFLIYDLLELGSLGTRLFLAVLDAVTFVLLSLYPRTFETSGVPVVPGLQSAVTDTGALRVVLALCAVVLLVSFVLEIVARGVLRTSEPAAASEKG